MAPLGARPGHRERAPPGRDPQRGRPGRVAERQHVIYGVLADPSIASLNPLSAATPSIANGAPLVTDTWSVPADGTGSPHLFNAGTWSEVVTNR